MAFAQSGLKSLVVAVLAFTGGGAQAESFAVQLGSRNLGSLVYDGGRSASLTSTLNNTPLGVFNGTFTASVAPTSAGEHYSGMSRSSRKNREINVLFNDGRAIDTIVTPADEMTDLSNVGAVPAGVIDPVSAFGRFVEAKSGCPATFRFYDGRRAILVQTSDSSEVAGQLVCQMDYRVTDGPGHLSPLYIKNISIALIYDVIGGQSLRKAVMSAAGFDLVLMRQG